MLIKIKLTLKLSGVGEPIIEPEIDLSEFLEKQRLSPQPSSAPPPEDHDDIDTSIAQVTSRSKASNVRKGKLQQIEWDSSLEELRREKAAADATRGALNTKLGPVAILTSRNKN